VSLQHNLKFIELPDAINLGSVAFDSIYHKVSVPISGKKPGEKIDQNGAVIEYALTIPKNAQNQESAVGLVNLIISREGSDIHNSIGMKPIFPPLTSPGTKLPANIIIK
jgi:molybdate/tungstate transport system substrate-binding protein